MLKVIFQSQISFFFRRAHSPITKDFPLWSIWPNEVTELPHHPRVDRSWRISTWCDPLKHCCWIDVIDHMYVCTAPHIWHQRHQESIGDTISKSGNSFLKNSHFYFLERGNLSGNKSGNCTLLRYFWYKHKC